MKYLSALSVSLICAAFIHAGPSVKEARQLWLEGYYDESREMCEALLKLGKERLPATLGLSKALQSEGEYDKALAVVTNLAKEMPESADLLARQAELMHLRGRLEEAEKTAIAALKENKENFLARWVLGQAYRDRGQMEKAVEEFRWFVRVSNKRNITDPEELRLAGLAGLERARYLHLTDEFQNIIDNYFREASDKDKYYWLGQYEAGRVFMDRHNKPGAFRAFEKVMTVNPRSAEVLVCKGQMAASNFEFQDAEKFAQQALKVNPRMVPALCLMAEVHWFSNEIDATVKLLMKARAVNPRDETMLALVAACQFAQHQQKEFDATIKEALASNPKCYTFYTDLAKLLEERKFNREAEKYYNIAIDLQPKLPEAETGLGMLYMRMGKEAEARKILEKASDADQFNVRVRNSLVVLDHLDKYQSLKTKHFIIRFDEKNDELLANFMAGYLEDIYKELGDQFDFHPKGPYQIQIFNKHEMFSGRVVAVPDLHTIGACTGPLVAMVSPHDTSKVIGKPFNWNRVIRHELVHVFNLQQTHSQVPHWFTEGLAVRYEGPNFPPSWHRLLADKFNADELLNLDNILLGFIRPRSPLQWQQAYMQSLFYIEYLTKTYGEKSIGKMLAAFTEGLDSGPALEKACNVKKEAFEKGYREFLGEKVKNIAAQAPQKNLTLKQLRAAHAKNPNDPDLAAQLAQKSFEIGKKREAKELADKVLTNHPKHPIAVYVKALLLIGEGSADIAYSLLDSVAADDLKETKPLKLLAKLQFEQKKYAQAAATCERGRKIEPNEPTWIAQLAKIYVKTGQQNKLLDIYEEVVKIDPDEFMPRKELAKHYQKQGDHAKAERFARMALEVNVRDRDCQRILVDSLTALDKLDEANRLRKMFDL